MGAGHGLTTGFWEPQFVEEGPSRDILGVSIPLLLLSPGHEGTRADFLAKGSGFAQVLPTGTPWLLPALHPAPAP